MSMYLLIICSNRHCVFFMDWESWIGVLDRSIGLEFWNKTLEWNRKFNSRDTIYLCANGGHFKT